ncbi:type IV pilus assembly protein [Mizugakiibacter sediminis]|uniref:Fimbrial protein n=1 Tax=Mizugakiibacter sediminis TaxID=1475481 RepID=A0A0K8QR38_9GAMM|nr:type IV pilin protein [Mizugakiibacter sediminis]GAP67394.1 type IV pilus assembly protein [Mizugakiibacter sediminis]
MRTTRGFSLIELMVVVAIIVILGAIAIPSYRQYALRAHRTDAKRTLMDAAQRQERYFYSNNRYAATAASIGLSSSSAGSYYTFGIVSASTTAYALQATPVGAQTQDTQCGTLGLDSAGRRTVSGTSASTPDDCWGK